MEGGDSASGRSCPLQRAFPLLTLRHRAANFTGNAANLPARSVYTVSGEGLFDRRSTSGQLKVDKRDLLGSTGGLFREAEQLPPTA